MGLELGGQVVAPPPRAMVSGETALVGIYEISKLLASANRLENVLAGVLTLLSSFLDMRHGLIALLDAKGAPEVVVGSGWSEGAAKAFFDRLPERAVGQIVATKMPVVIEDVAASPLFEGVDLSGWGTDDGQSFSMIGVPIKDGDTVVGTLTVDRARNLRSSVLFDHDVRFLTMIANLVGQTLRLHKLIARDRERLMQESAWREKAATIDRKSVV
jgi:Nif-specific regulatory protein